MLNAGEGDSIKDGHLLGTKTCSKHGSVECVHVPNFHIFCRTNCEVMKLKHNAQNDLPHHAKILASKTCVNHICDGRSPTTVVAMRPL